MLVRFTARARFHISTGKSSKVCVCRAASADVELGIEGRTFDQDVDLPNLDFA